MRDTYVDVLVEIPVADLAREADMTRYMWELMRESADRLCAENGAHLRTDRAPELTIREGQHPLLGIDMFLCASRWAAVAPESVTAA